MNHLYEQFASNISRTRINGSFRVLCKPRLIFSRINGPAYCLSLHPKSTFLQQTLLFVLFSIIRVADIFVFLCFFFQDCAFNKLKSDTALKVSFQGNMRVYGNAKCNRWYFKFNGNECSGPMTIEAVIYNGWPSGNPNLLHHRSFEGYCENIPQGAVGVELWVGQCNGHTLGSAAEVSLPRFRMTKFFSFNFSRKIKQQFK